MGGLVNPSLEAILSARPDVVIMTTDGNPEGFEERLKKFGIKTYVLRERRLVGLPQEIVSLGRALGAGDKAESLAAEIRDSWIISGLQQPNLRAAKECSLSYGPSLS